MSKNEQKILASLAVSLSEAGINPVAILGN